MTQTGQPRGGIEGLGPAPVVILCRTQMGENLGTAARAMLNFGLTELRLVAPQCGWPNAKAVAAASGAVEILNRLEVFPDLKSAATDIHHLFATTARPRELAKPVRTAEEAVQDMAGLIGQGRRAAIVFGPERTGLTNDELLLADAVVSFPVNPAFASLNLAQAVLLCAYEWFKRASGGAAPQSAPMTGPRPATKAEVGGLVDHLVRELDEVDFFRAQERRASMIRTITVLFERRQLTSSEVDLLRGMVKDLVGGRKARQKPDTP